MKLAGKFDGAAVDDVRAASSGGACAPHAVYDAHPLADNGTWMGSWSGLGLRLMIWAGYWAGLDPVKAGWA
ncbi:hypothetical protein ACFX2J_005233 [Malus domestica]